MKTKQKMERRAKINRIEEMVYKLEKTIREYYPDDPEDEKKADEFTRGILNFITNALTTICLAKGVKTNGEKFKEMHQFLTDMWKKRLNETWEKWEYVAEHYL